ncbi:hypothetical protein B0J18DRAFT_291429 [Chaetomium sp. MPI-SDFR-AT-0129]|nr:hypothetical protein B0J18DRAFT_291429 [Chaetomium sp. MPI-SDFR-AT-0129]
MARPYIIGDSSPFLKRVLIPFWVVRIIIMLIQIGLYAIVVTGLSVFRDDVGRLYDEYHTSLTYDGVLAVSCVIMGIILFCLLLDIVCIIMRARRTLTPPFFLGVNIVQNAFYIANFILTMIGARNGVASIAIGVLILLSFLGLLLYASIVYHQYRKGSLNGGAYVQASGQEGHKLVTHTGYGGHNHEGIHDVPVPPQQKHHSYGESQPYAAQTPAYYNPHTVGATQNEYAPQAYEPFRGQQHHSAV